MSTIQDLYLKEAKEEISRSYKLCDSSRSEMGLISFNPIYISKSTLDSKLSIIERLFGRESDKFWEGGLQWWLDSIYIPLSDTFVKEEIERLNYLYEIVTKRINEYRVEYKSGLEKLQTANQLINDALR